MFFPPHFRDSLIIIPITRLIIIQMAQNEGRIALAIQAHQRGQFSSLRAACSSYNAPYSTALDRVKGVLAKRDSQPKSRKLTDLEEQTLEQWILAMIGRGLPVGLQSIRAMANLLLSKRAGADEVLAIVVGHKWVYNYIKRHNNLQSKYTRKYDYQRALCEDVSIIRAWFDLVRNTIAKYGILEEDIYNFDETGFQMGVIATVKVVTGRERAGRAVAVQPGNREWVTAIESIDSTGDGPPPVIILEGKVHISTWYSNDLPRDWVIALSEKGWTNDQLGLLWLTTVFEPYTAPRTRGVYRLLILDGHGSHITPEFDLFCTEHKIITLCMPAHSSHLLQPLDLSCFATLKRAYGRQIEQLMRNGVNYIDKPDFLTAYYKARTEAITPTIARSGFTAAGLVPFNPERVLEKLNTQIRTPTPLPAPLPLQQWIPETPQHPEAVDLQAKSIKESLHRRMYPNIPSSPTESAFQQLVKCAKIAMHTNTVLTEENRQLRAENQRQKRKRAIKRSFIQSGGVLTVQQGIELVETAENGPVGREVDLPEEPQPRAVRMCSVCRSAEHTARTCPIRIR